MDALTADIYARLNGDEDLTTTQGVETTQGRLKQDPKLLSKPRVVFRIFGGPTDGGAGAKVNAYVEMEVWGYDGDRGNVGARLPACLAAAQRVSELMLTRFITVTGGGGTAKPREALGWQQVPDTDPLIVHLHNGFNIRYWSAQRVAALNA